MTFPVGGVAGQTVAYNMPPLIETKEEQGVGVKAESEVAAPWACRLIRRL